jgi:type IV secretion system protein VirD4
MSEVRVRESKGGKYDRPQRIDDYSKRPEEMLFSRFLGNTRIFRRLYLLLAAAVLLLLNYSLRGIATLDFGAMPSGGAVFHGSPSLLLPSPALIPVYAAYAIFAAILYMYMSFHIRQSHKRRNLGLKGSQRWTTREELKEQYKSVPAIPPLAPGKAGERLFFEGRGGFPVAEDIAANELLIDDSDTHNIVLGMTRGGKGETVGFRTIDVYSRSKERPSLIITDPKLELAAASIPALRDRGYECHILNFIEPHYSMGYNPLSTIVDAYRSGDIKDAQNLAGCLAFSMYNGSEKGAGENQYFTDASSCTYAAVILAMTADAIEKDRLTNDIRKAEHEAAGDDTPFISIYENEKYINGFSTMSMMVNMQNIKIGEKSELDIYFEKRPENDPARMLYGVHGMAGERQKGNVRSTTAAALRTFLTEDMATLTAESTINFKDLVFSERPIALFLGISDTNTAYFFLATTFIDQANFVLSRLASSFPGQALPRYVINLLDEIGNMPAINNFDVKLSMSAGRHILYTLMLQSFMQLNQRYTEAIAANIVGNCGNLFYLLSADAETTAKIARVLGKETLSQVTVQGEALMLTKNLQESPEDRFLLDENELMRLMPGECVVHRTVKRTDLAGNAVRPYPIYNDEHHRLRYRHEYLRGWFPDDNVLYLTDAMREGYSHTGTPLPSTTIAEGKEGLDTREHIDFRERVWSTKAYIEEDKKLWQSASAVLSRRQITELSGYFELFVRSEKERARIGTDPSVTVRDLINTALAAKESCPEGHPGKKVFGLSMALALRLLYSAIGYDIPPAPPVAA